MFKKFVTIIVAVTIALSMAGNAFATFGDLELIRVYYDRNGSEIATDLGNVNSIIASGGTISGSFTGITTGFAAYFALDRATSRLWVSGSTSTPSVINGTSGGLTTTLSGTTNVYSLYNIAGGGTSTTLASATNSYKNKLSATQGYFGNAINSATRLNTEASLTTLISAGTGSINQILYFWNNGLTTVAADKIGVAVATITTNADGSTVISPPPTPATAPDAPIIGTATATRDDLADVTFTAPASDGGSTITLYTVTSSPDGLISTGHASPITVNGLVYGKSYTFTVTAKNSIGTSPPSLASNSVTTSAPAAGPTATAPGAPTIGTATADNVQATVSFSAPASDGGSAITGYTVTSDPTGGTDTNAGTTSMSHIITGLANGTPYTFTVTAMNSIGTSGPSQASNPPITLSVAPVTPVTPVAPATTAPGAPTAVTAIAGNAQETVSFIAPASDGGNAITGYTVTSDPAGGTDTNAGTTSMSHIITGLANGTPYTFTVTATNANGTGMASARSNSVTPVTPPITFTVFPASVVNGSINPATKQTVNAGASTSITVIPNIGYQISAVTGDSCSLAMTGHNTSTGSYTYTTSGIIHDCTVSATFIETPLKGDLDGINGVTIADALLALRFAVGLQTPTDKQIAAAPMGALKGKIDIADAVAILQKSVGLLDWK